jgi:hypothetical protein
VRCIKHNAQYKISLEVELLNVGLVELFKGEYDLTIVTPVRNIFLVIGFNATCVEVIVQ